MKQFSTARNKGLYKEEKSKEGGRGDQEEKRERKKGERNLASNQIPKCSPQPRTPREILKVMQRREEGGRR